MLANGIAPGRISPGKGFIDNDRARLTGDILRSEVAPAQNRHAHHIEIVGRDYIYFRRRFFSEFVRRRAGEMEVTVPLVIIERNISADSGGGDSGQSANFL